MDEINNRRVATQSRTTQLRDLLGNAAQSLENRACVYATGSFGRLEAREDSDLDLFIVGKTDTESKASPKGSQLSHLDEICLKADLIRATKQLGIKEFDGDGKYLQHYSVAEFTSTLGKPEDDANNTLTGRLLLCLESKPLLGEDVYKSVIKEVIDAYWRDYDDHKSEFLPAYLTNDILRLWRTFCVNYEARTERRPDPKKIKGKIKNYKLKHSRMLTCYSSLLYLLTIYKRHKTVTPDDAFNMTQLTPIDRVSWLLDQSEASAAHKDATSLLQQYDKFLKLTSIGETALEGVFSDTDKSKTYMEESRKFGDDMYATLSKIDESSRYYRIIVV